MCKTQEIQQRIDELTRRINEHAPKAAPSTSDIITDTRLEILALSLQLAEISTRRVVWLTVALLLLTGALLAVEIKSVFFPKDFAASTYHIQTDTNQQVVIPSITK